MHNEFIEAGYRIFGLYGVDENGVCECGNSDCKALFKHPRFSNWPQVPEWSEDQMEVMEETGQLATGYGVLVSGLLVVDVDARNGGVASYEKLLADIPEIAGAGFIVKTGSGNGSKHLYFSVPTGFALVQHLDKYRGIDFKGSGFVVGPGSNHASGNKYEAIFGTPYDITPAPQSLLNLLKKPETYRASAGSGLHIDVTEADIANMLSFIDPDCAHEVWYRCGMAVHHATQGAGFDLWDQWSKGSKAGKYPGSDALGRRWHSFGKSANPVTIGTLKTYAEAAGWVQPVTFESDIEIPEDEGVEDGLPFSIDGVDLLRPPGFVGEVARWIGDQSRRPRGRLAVAGALTAIGNVAGLRYTDDRDGVTTNLFAFCIAGARTGKESTQQAVAEIHRVAGMGLATHGAIKSEQEIVRNLIRNQAALYIVDEVGIFLKKVKNAQERGGASYLEGVIGMLMAAYSKADSSMLLTGDAREEMQDVLMKEIAQVNKQLESGINTAKWENKLLGLQSALARLDKGLDRPFVSVIGFTTPVTFDESVDFYSATNGFIGRALLFNERETVPRSIKRFKRRKMPDSMAATIMQLYNAGEFDAESDGRVEYYGDRIEVVTEDQASNMLDDVVDWMEDQAELQKSLTGLESLYLGAYELVSKISLILACPSGVRTAEHVRWAFALVRNDLEAKTRLVTANDRQKDSPDVALHAKIANIIDGDGEKLGVIYNRLRTVSRADVDAMLESMLKKGTAIKRQLTHARNKKTYDVYQLNSKA